MKRILAIVAMALVVGVVYLYFRPFGARVDGSFDTVVRNPANTGRHPVMLVDGGHNNAHTAAGRYAPFAKLMRNDGYDVRGRKGPFTREALAHADVLVIVNASGGTNPQLFGINLEPLRKGERDAPAFTPEEIEIVSAWVRDGGSLLLIGDHYPFGVAAANLAAAFGVTMHGGFAEVAHQYEGQTDPGAIEFSSANGLLAEHAITKGRSDAERVGRVMSFTGQSLDAPNAVAILKLPPSAKEFVPPPPEFKEAPAGSAQGVALEFGQGRAVILGEAGMLTAQIDHDERFGMNVDGLDNRQFALNVAHWLSHLL